VTHTEFITAYRAGRVTVEFDAALAGKFLGARLLLPLLTLPLLGAGVALALLGWPWSGLLVTASGMLVPRLIKRSAPHFLLTQTLSDAKLYADAQQAGIMRVVAAPHAAPAQGE
jgi:hypothetical protein